MLSYDHVIDRKQRLILLKFYNHIYFIVGFLHVQLLYAYAMTDSEREGKREIEVR